MNDYRAAIADLYTVIPVPIYALPFPRRFTPCHSRADLYPIIPAPIYALPFPSRLTPDNSHTDLHPAIPAPISPLWIPAKAGIADSVVAARP